MYIYEEGDSDRVACSLTYYEGEGPFYCCIFRQRNTAFYSLILCFLLLDGKLCLKHFFLHKMCWTAGIAQKKIILFLGMETDKRTMCGKHAFR